MENINITFEIVNSDDYESTVLSTLILLLRDLKYLETNCMDKDKINRTIKKMHKVLELLEEGE